MIRENDYALANRKFGGNAQYLSKMRWLHHSSLLWSYDPTRMQLLSLPPKMPEYRQQRDHSKFLCCLKDYLPRRELIFESVKETLAERFLIQMASLSALNEILKRPHRQSVIRY
jgi:lipoate-protein ligase A